MPADLTYPRRLVLAPGESRDLFEDFQGYAELVPVGSTSQAGEAGEGQTIVSGTVALSPSSGSITIGAVTPTGTVLTATVAVANPFADATFELRWTATTNLGKVLSRKVYLDIKDV